MLQARVQSLSTRGCTVGLKMLFSTFRSFLLDDSDSPERTLPIFLEAEGEGDQFDAFILGAKKRMRVGDVFDIYTISPFTLL